MAGLCPIPELSQVRVTGQVWEYSSTRLSASVLEFTLVNERVASMQHQVLSFVAACAPVPSGDSVLSWVTMEKPGKA